MGNRTWTSPGSTQSGSSGRQERTQKTQRQVKDDVKFDLNKLAAGEMFCVNCPSDAITSHQQSPSKTCKQDVNKYIPEMNKI